MTEGMPPEEELQAREERVRANAEGPDEGLRECSHAAIQGHEEMGHGIIYACTACHMQFIPGDMYQRVLTAERERADRLDRVARDLLGTFTEKGHPGRPCLRSGWVWAEQVERWRAALSRTATEEDDRD